ncbi:NADPH-dependent aldehyde reductase ARI1 [Acropora cervicornis]|uniref:NADPH-dependent aldehyde reductase ARI1 n=1 Tax=Acropora cervicornis TaxID=6130 RepID=A0AAD9R5T9_ACRCE|nr:NADPH-dependent aldehyde reductase ARI1 [Acropora cervicornis]
MARVLVTGASGFLASHIVRQLLEAGEYMVRGTVRSLSNEKKVGPLKKLKPENAKYDLELVEADLTNKESWTEAVKDCTYVLHVASPFPAENPRDEMEVIRPAVEGTKNVLDACAKTKGAVKRVVVTSSVVAIYAGRFGEGNVFTEEDWAAEEGVNPYEKSKAKAEKAAWELVKNLQDDEKFELVVINPGRLLNREDPLVPKVCLPICDVRDTAKAHISALTASSAPGYNVPTCAAPKIGLQIYSWFDGTVKQILPSVNQELKFDNSKAKQDLQYQPTELKTSIVDMAYNLIDSGFVKMTPKYKEVKKVE